MTVNDTSSANCTFYRLADYYANLSNCELDFALLYKSFGPIPHPDDVDFWQFVDKVSRLTNSDAVDVANWLYLNWNRILGITNTTDVTEATNQTDS